MLAFASFLRPFRRPLFLCQSQHRWWPCRWLSRASPFGFLSARHVLSFLIFVQPRWNVLACGIVQRRLWKHHRLWKPMVAWPSVPDVLQVGFQKEQRAANIAEESFLFGEQRNVDVLPACEPVFAFC